ncbi:MAG: hypothetical protein V7640_86 [Betaproteobacteria bacterium]|jgi:hypothetical protein
MTILDSDLDWLLTRQVREWAGESAQSHCACVIVDDTPEKAELYNRGGCVRSLPCHGIIII